MSLVEGLRTRLLQQVPDVTGHDDYDMLPRTAQFGAARAAVLLPVVARAEPAVLFTRRTDTLVRHGGQVSFPGGRCEPHDISPVETALRDRLRLSADQAEALAEATRLELPEADHTLSKATDHEQFGAAVLAWLTRVA